MNWFRVVAVVVAVGWLLPDVAVAQPEGWSSVYTLNVTTGPAAGSYSGEWDSDLGCWWGLGSEWMFWIEPDDLLLLWVFEWFMGRLTHNARDDGMLREAHNFASNTPPTARQAEREYGSRVTG